MQQVYLVYSDDYDPHQRRTVARKVWQPGMIEPAYIDTMRRQIHTVPAPTNDDDDDDTGTVYVTHDTPPAPASARSRWGLVVGAISGVLSLAMLAELWSLLTAHQYGTAALLLGAVIFGVYGLTRGGEG